MTTPDHRIAVHSPKTRHSVWRATLCSISLMAGGMLLLEAPAQAQNLGAAQTFSILVVHHIKIDG